MHTDVITVVPTWVLLAYLISGVCFILALRGLSSPESSRRGNFRGMVGMTIAIATTLGGARIGVVRPRSSSVQWSSAAASA